MKPPHLDPEVVKKPVETSRKPQVGKKFPTGILIIVFQGGGDGPGYRGMYKITRGSDLNQGDWHVVCALGSRALQ
jgi:hypothetical protein